MEFYRIGNKVVNRDKVNRMIKNILDLRKKGFSQSRVADEVGVARSFISRIESIGEVRKGGRIALLGFPIKNKKEILDLVKKYGIDFSLVLTETERWNFIQEKSGLELFNQLMELLVKLQEFDLIIFIGSDMRLDLIDNLLDGNIAGVKLGESPLTEDKYVDPGDIIEIIDNFEV
ncbi:MAG: helix-turn-helix domain-containing protein [Bacillota bacterium]